MPALQSVSELGLRGDNTSSSQGRSSQKRHKVEQHRVRVCGLTAFGMKERKRVFAVAVG